MSNSTPITPESWEALLEAVRETEHDLAGVAPFRDTLADAHTRAIMLKTTRDSQVASAQEARRSYREALTMGKDAAVALRGFIQSVLGLRNEQLACYGLQPRGKRCRGLKRKLEPAPSASRRKVKARAR
ncbi:MAG: hypothetical protein ACJ76Y_22635 [Thermoanaerobaculia bacterium]